MVSPFGQVGGDYSLRSRLVAGLAGGRFGGASGASASDADAAAYIAAVEGTGYSFSEAQVSALDDFFAAGWTRDYGLTRIHLFTYGQASSNAIDLVNLGSGTFSGSYDDTTVTGAVKGDASTAEFEIDADASTILDSTGFNFGALLVTRPSITFDVIMGTGIAGSNMVIGSDSSTTRIYAPGVGSTTALQISGVLEDGMLVCLDWDNTTRRVIKRASGSNSTEGSNTVSNTNTVASDPFTVFCRRGADQHSDAAVGMAWTGDSLGVTDSGNFMEALQTLWEAMAGTTL